MLIESAIEYSVVVDQLEKEYYKNKDNVTEVLNTIQSGNDFFMKNMLQKVDTMDRTVVSINERTKDDSTAVQALTFKVDSSEENLKTWTTELLYDMKKEMMQEIERQK